MIEARGLTRRFGDVTAVQDMSFSVSDGEILGILGPNGAGKTTTIRMLTGFLPPSAGTVTLDGVDLQEQPVEARRRLGYLPENVALYPEMRVREYLRYRGRLAAMKGRDIEGAIEKTLAGCLLQPVADQVISTLSKGYRQRVGLAAAILHGPRVLILDEPTVGLDPKQIIAIRELIQSLGRDRTLLLSTHILPEVEQICDRALIIDRGRLVAEGTPSELLRQSGGETELTLTLDGRPDGAEQTLGDLDGILSVMSTGSRTERPDELRLRLSCGGTDLRREVFQLAVAQGWTLLELSEKRVSLEEVFVRLTTDDGPQSAKASEAPAPEAPADPAGPAEEDI